MYGLTGIGPLKNLFQELFPKGSLLSYHWLISRGNWKADVFQLDCSWGAKGCRGEKEGVEFVQKKTCYWFPIQSKLKVAWIIYKVLSVFRNEIGSIFWVIGIWSLCSKSFLPSKTSLNKEHCPVGHYPTQTPALFCRPLALYNYSTCQVLRDAEF